ncbi:hypothetical protein BC835DRAFT_1362697 [Cytidiella melzeri]|nr:hypothetical protein BC835DRAFT_1362697 [Cytidiella melzeri]
MPEYVYALHDFTPENPDEVRFKSGDKIEVIEKDDVYQDGWWQGRNPAGQVGLFPQAYTTSRPPTSVPTEDLRSIPSVELRDPSPPPLQPLVEEYEPSPDEHRRTLSQGEKDMQDTLTDVQRAIEQLGQTDDSRRSFSFTSSHGGDTDRSETETEGTGPDSEDEAVTGWHRDARQRLAMRAQQHNEERQKRESGGSAPMTPLRISAPPIDVELSDSSEDEDEELEEVPKRLSNRRSAGRTPDPRIPHIPEHDEEISGSNSEATPHIHNSEIPSLTSAAAMVQPLPSSLAESEGGHIEPSEDFIVPSPSRPNETFEDELPTATADRLTFHEVPDAAEIPLPLSPPPIASPSAPINDARNPSPSPVPPTLAVVSSQSNAPVTTDKYRIPGALAPMTPISPETDNASTPIPPPAAPSSMQATPVPTTRAAPAAISVLSIPFLARSTSPGRNSLATSQLNPSPSISSTGSIGLSSTAGIQQTLTPATTANLPTPQRDSSPNGSQRSNLRSKPHPSDWTVEEVVDWLRSKGFDQSVCDIFTEQEITGDVLLEIDHNILKTEFDIKAFGKRVRIINAIAELRRPPSFTESEHPMQNLSASTTQSFNYGHSHTSSMQSSAVSSVPQSYANSPMAYNGSNFSPAPSSRGFPSAGVGSFASPESPMYMPVPEMPVAPTGVLASGWATAEQPSVIFPSAVTSQTSFSTAREQPSDSAPETFSMPPSQSGMGLGLGFPSTAPTPHAESASPASKTKTRPSNLVLSPSDANLKVTAAGDDSPHAVDDRTALSDSEATHLEGKVSRRRFFGRSAESTSLKEKPSSIRDTTSRHSKEASPATPASVQGELAGDSPVRRHSKKKSTDDRKGSDRLSLFGGMSMPTLGVHVGSRSRKPVPSIAPSIEEEHDRSTLSSFRRMGHGKRSISRPSTANAPDLHEKDRVETTLMALNPSQNQAPIADEKEKDKDKDKDKLKKSKDPALLRKRTSSGTDVTNRSPALPAASVGLALKPGKSILAQIGTPDHNGWMRRKSENYNSWKMRYFVLKGPHLYCLKSNDRTETKIKGYINITGYKVVADEKIDPGRYGFKMIHDSDKTHFFSHDEQLVIREWMKALIKSTISRDFHNPVVSSSNIPTIPLTVAQAMTPSPRPPSPTARAATQRAHRRDNPNQLSSRDAEVLMSLTTKGKPTNGSQNGDRPKLDTVFTEDGIKTPQPSSPTSPKKSSSKVPPPRPSREIRRTLSNNARSSTDTTLDNNLLEWANSHLPASFQITDPSGSLCSGLALLRLAEDIKGSPSSPPVPDSAFPTSPADERLDGLFRLFDFLLDNDVKMGTVSINDIRQGKREKIIQLLQAMRAWEDKRKAIALSLTLHPSPASGNFMAGPVPYFN